jgi:hypothetical protein
MEFIFQISGHPKVGKKIMPGLSAVSLTPKEPAFPERLSNRLHMYSQMNSNFHGGCLGGVRFLVSRPIFRIFITLICRDMQELYLFNVNFDGALAAIDICP